MAGKLFSKERILLILFMLFVILFELYHVSIGTNPPTGLRLIYIAVYVMFSVLSPALIPIYTAVNLIIERFSSVFGEYLPSTLIFHILVLLLGILSLKNPNVFRASIVSNHKSLVCFIVMYIYGVLSLILHVNVPLDFSFVLNGAFMLFYLYFLIISKDKYVIYVIKCSVIAMAIVCAIGLYNYDSLVSDYATSLGYVDRLEWKDANYFSFFIGAMLLFTLFLARYTTSKFYRKVYLVISILMFVTMTSLISRGAIVALVIALVYYYRKDIVSFRNLGYLFLLSLIVLGLLYIGALDGIITRFMSEDMQTGSGRTEIWEVGINTFFSKDWHTVLFGAGESQALKMAYMNGSYWSPHNNYLSIMYRYGIIGLFLFVLWLVLLYREAKTRESRSVLILIIINSLTIVPFTYVAPLLFVMPLIEVWDYKLKGRLN